MIVLPNIHGALWHRDEPMLEGANYLLDNILPTKGVGLLVGEPSVGKTFLTIGMATSIATGAWFLGSLPASASTMWHPRTIETGATLIIAGEGFDTYSSRVEAAFCGLHGTYVERLRLLGLERLPICRISAHGLRNDAKYGKCLADIQEMQEFFALIGDAIRLRLIVVDTLPAVYGFHDENSAAEAQDAMNKLSNLANVADAFVLATTHPRKSQRTQRVRGSGVFEGSADIILNAYVNGRTGKRRLKLTKSRYREAEAEGHEYRLVSIVLPNGITSAYVDGIVGESTPPATTTLAPIQGAGGERYTQDAADVRSAILEATKREPCQWTTFLGQSVSAARETTVREELDRVKHPNSNDSVKRRDALRKSLKRGIEWLSVRGLIDQTVDTKSGERLYWIADLAAVESE